MFLYLDTKHTAGDWWGVMFVVITSWGWRREIEIWHSGQSVITDVLLNISSTSDLSSNTFYNSYFYSVLKSLLIVKCSGECDKEKAMTI